MSLYGALYAGVAGLQAQSNELGIISDNVANVNTVGYKEASATFETLVTNASGATSYSPGGVLGGNHQQVDVQGLLTTTSSPTDIAISGSGMYVVNQSADQSGQVLYTRAGSFTQDASGNFKNSAGYFLQAWPLDRNGNLPGAPGNSDTVSSANLSSLQTVNVQNISGTAAATSTVSLGANLNASQAAFAGAAGTVSMDASDSVNTGITANTIIIPTTTDSLTRGDSFKVATGANPTGYNYVYGGFSAGRSVTDASNLATDEGDSATPVLAAPASVISTALPVAAAGFVAHTNTASASVVYVTVASTAALRSGYTVNISGATGTNGLTSGQINGNQVITVVDATHFSFVSTGTATTAGSAVSTTAGDATPNPLQLNNTTITPTVVGTSGANNQINVTVPSTAGLRTGDTVTMAGVAAFDNFLSGDVNGAFQITVDDATHFHYTASAHTASGAVNSGAPGTATSDPIATTSGSHTLTISQPSNGLVVGNVVTLSGISGAVAGIPASELNSSFVVTAIVDANHYQVATPTTAASSTGGGGTGTIISTTRPFVGNVLDATNATQTLLGTTGTSGFSAAGLKFTITTPASGTQTFTYTSSSPNAQSLQFNTLTNLADAINTVSGITAKVANGRLYVGATDANAQITFANGASAGVSGPPVQAAIDWVGELGLANVAASAGNNRYSTLQSLANLVNGSAGLAATVSNPLGAASMKINVVDPLDTVDFTDAAYGGGKNTGSPLAALGLSSTSLGGVAPSGTPITTGSLGPSYDASNSLKNMAAGVISPQFSRPITVYDAQGAPHNLNVAFLKTATNTWAVEIYAQPASDVTETNGQVASGTIVFNDDGSLRSVSSGLSLPVTVNWTDGAGSSTLAYNWGNAGKTDGLSQFSSSFNVNFANQNGAPKGQLTGVSISAAGIITASYSNGQTQNLYKIPLAEFSDSDQLQSVSGNAFAQTAASGQFNLKEPGQSGVGTLSSGALEASNVELANELTTMIVAQRAYQANTKVISTADQLLQNLDQIIQ